MITRVRRVSSGTYHVSVEAVTDAGALVVYGQTPTVTVASPAYTATFPAIAAPGSLTATITLPATLDVYELTWTDETSEWTTWIELVGGFLFSLGTLIELEPAFRDGSRWPLKVLEAARMAAEETIEGIGAAGVAFVPRGRRIHVVTYAPTITVPDFEVRAVYSAGAVDVSTVTITDNRLEREGGWGGKCEVHYEHGRNYPPTQIARAAMKLAREYALASDLPERATAASIGDQMFRLTIAGRDGITGIPDVDAAIAAHGRRRFESGVL